jgi:transcriptional regulator with XRE-family HTH domain
VANEQLRRAMKDAGLRLDDVARAVGINAKTVERWITRERVPRPASREQVARLLGVDEGELWPERPPGDGIGAPDLVRVYPDRAAVPATRWKELLESATERIDALVYGGLFLPDPRADLPGILRDKADDGVRIRLLFGDPDSAAIARRGAEEGLGSGLAARIRLALSFIAPACEAPGVEARLHATTLYNSIYRYDDELLINTHAHGVAAADCPVLHVRRAPGGRLFEHYMTSLERVWEQAAPAGGLVATPRSEASVGA